MHQFLPLKRKYNKRPLHYVYNSSFSTAYEEVFYNDTDYRPLTDKKAQIHPTRSYTSGRFSIMHASFHNIIPPPKREYNKYHSIITGTYDNLIQLTHKVF